MQCYTIFTVSLNLTDAAESRRLTVNGQLLFLAWLSFHKAPFPKHVSFALSNKKQNKNFFKSLFLFFLPVVNNKVFSSGKTKIGCTEYITASIRHYRFWR